MDMNANSDVWMYKVLLVGIHGAVSSNFLFGCVLLFETCGAILAGLLRSSPLHPEVVLARFLRLCSKPRSYSPWGGGEEIKEEMGKMTGGARPVVL